MAQKVATARKMKSQQETINRQAFINTDTRRFKIQTGNGTPPPLALSWQQLSYIA